MPNTTYRNNHRTDVYPFMANTILPFDNSFIVNCKLGYTDDSGVLQYLYVSNVTITDDNVIIEVAGYINDTMSCLLCVCTCNHKAGIYAVTNKHTAYNVSGFFEILSIPSQIVSYKGIFILDNRCVHNNKSNAIGKQRGVVVDGVGYNCSRILKLDYNAQITCTPKPISIASYSDITGLYFSYKSDSVSILGDTTLEISDNNNSRIIRKINDIDVISQVPITSINTSIGTTLILKINKTDQPDTDNTDGAFKASKISNNTDVIKLAGYIDIPHCDFNDNYYDDFGELR